MRTKLEMLNNIFYDKPYNSDKYLELCYYQQFTNLADEFPNGRRLEFYANASENDYFLIATQEDLTLQSGQTTFNLEKNNMLIWQPRGRQVIISPIECIFYVFIFSGHSVKEILQSVELQTNMIYSFNPNPKNKIETTNMYRQFSYIYSELYVNKHLKYNSVIATSLFIEFLGMFSRHKYTTPDDENTYIIQNVLDSITKNISSNIDIDEIIKKTHLSRSSFYIAFKQYTGTTLIKYINDKRLSAAADTLAVLDRSVADSARAVGFEDPIYFAKLFKRKYNMTPSEYKKTHISHKSFVKSAFDNS